MINSFMAIKMLEKGKKTILIFDHTLKHHPAKVIAIDFALGLPIIQNIKIIIFCKRH
jgi:hypothetical protein